MIGSEFQQKIIAIDSPEFLKRKHQRDLMIDNIMRHREPEIYDVAQEDCSLNLYPTKQVNDTYETEKISLYLSKSQDANNDVVTEDAQIFSRSNQTKSPELESDHSEIVAIKEDIEENVIPKNNKTLKLLLLAGSLYLLFK